MENCLVTELKSVVSDNSLQKFGMLSFKVNTDVSESENNSFYRLYNSVNPTKAKVGSGDILFYNTFAATSGTAETTLPTTTYTRFIKGNSGTFDVENKYNIIGIEMAKRFNLIGGLETLKSISGLTKLSLFTSGDIASLQSSIATLQSLGLNDIDTNNRVYGTVSLISASALTSFTVMCTDVLLNIAELASNTALTSIRIPNTKCYGSITTGLGNNTLLTRMEIYGSNVSGDLKEFVLAQIAAGRSTCDRIDCPAIGNCPNITTGSATIREVRSGGWLSWTSSDSIIYHSGNGTTTWTL